MGKRGLQQTRAQHADDLPRRVTNRLIGDQVPIVDHERRGGPDAAAVQHFFAHGDAQLGPDRALAGFRPERGRNPQIAQENGHGADLFALVHFVAKHLLLDRVDDLVTLVEQITAVEHRLHLSLGVEHGHRHGGHHPVGAKCAAGGPCGFRGDDPDRSPAGKLRSLRQQPLSGENDGPAHDFPLAKGSGNQGVGRKVVAGLLASRPANHFSSRVQQGHEVHTLAPCQVVQYRFELHSVLAFQGGGQGAVAGRASQ